MKKYLVNTARKIKNLVKPNDRIKLLRRMPRKAVCAEIGVWKGEFSSSIITETRPDTLHLIDPWMFFPEFPDRMYGGKIAKGQQDMDRIYEGVKETIGSLPGVEVHRGPSAEALESFNDNYFDWVYIDGNHYYEYVKKDLELSFQKVKNGGYIAGDDYDWGAQDGYPVQQAVSDFISERKGQLSDLTVIGNQFFVRKAAA